MIRPSGKSAVVGAIALTTALAVAGCSSPGSSSGSSSGSGSTQNSSFRNCLEQHGITPPSGGNFPQSGSSPHPRPTGSRSTSFQQAIKACGGFGG